MGRKIGGEGTSDEWGGRKVRTYPPHIPTTPPPMTRQVPWEGVVRRRVVGCVVEGDRGGGKGSLLTPPPHPPHPPLTYHLQDY